MIMLPNLLKATLLFFTLATFSACEEESIASTPNTGEQEYFPLSIGQTKTYEVDSILLLQEVSGTVYDTARLTVQEILQDTFIAADGRLWYRGERYEKDRDAPDSEYRITRTFTVSTDAQVALRSENNLSFTKLVFPARTGERWDGNGDFDEFRQFAVGGEFLDIYAGWETFYQTVDSTADDRRFLRVEQAQVDNVIDLRQAYEVYETGVGLVEKFLDARHTQCQVCCGGDTAPCIDLPWDEKAEKGFILRQRLIE
ncbi:hypothetical protein CEQ90_04380 [Lewinellaceae bacterium SD302]|nr:hypothetical protein CEQ90_04380 [Lewinellaceae bacterium SD302]